MTATPRGEVRRVTTAEVRERQAKILAALHLSLDEMRERADDFALDARERGLAREYERLEFLVNRGSARTRVDSPEKFNEKED